jgi:hypothetical protein
LVPAEEKKVHHETRMKMRTLEGVEEEAVAVVVAVAVAEAEAVAAAVPTEVPAVAGVKARVRDKDKVRDKVSGREGVVGNKYYRICLINKILVT